MQRVFDQNLTATRLRAFYNPFIGFLPNLGLAIILLVGGRQVINGTLSLGDFTAFYAYLLMLIGPMRQLGVALGLAQRATASGARLFEVLDRAPRLTAPADARPLPEGRGRVELATSRSHSEASARRSSARSTWWSRRARRWRSSARPARARRTLVQLLPRLYDPTEGSVRIDGADLRTLDLASLRRQIAVVDDDPFLFSDTVANNIAYAGRTRRREEIERGGASARRRPASSPSCPTATTRASASAG